MFQQISLSQVQTQKQALDQLSLTLIKNTFLIGTYMILYIRNVFREEAFVLSRLEDLTVVELLPVNNETDAIIKILSKGVFEAVDKKYVRLLFFEIKDKNDNTLECYKFCFHYKTGEVCMQKLASMTDKKMQMEKHKQIDHKKNLINQPSISEKDRMNIQASENPDIRRMNLLERLANRKAEREKEKEKEKELTNLKFVEMEKIYKKSLNKKSLTLLTSILNTKGHLNPLPEKSYIMVKMMYYDNTPSDYIPPYFADLSEDVELQYEEQPMEYTLGELKTGFHAMKINLQSVCFRTYEPLQTKQSEKIIRKESKEKNNEETQIDGTKGKPKELFTSFSPSAWLKTQKDTNEQTLSKTQTQEKTQIYTKVKSTNGKNKKRKRKCIHLSNNKRKRRLQREIRNRNIKKAILKKQKQIKKSSLERIEKNDSIGMNQRMIVDERKTNKEKNPEEKNSKENTQKELLPSKKKLTESEIEKSLETMKEIKRIHDTEESKRSSVYKEKIIQKVDQSKNKPPKKIIKKISNNMKEPNILSNSQTRNFTKRAQSTKDLTDESSFEKQNNSANLSKPIEVEPLSISNHYIEIVQSTNSEQEIFTKSNMKRSDADKKKSKKRKRHDSIKKIKNKKETNNMVQNNTSKKICKKHKLQTNNLQKKNTSRKNNEAYESVLEIAQTEKRESLESQSIEGNGKDQHRKSNNQKRNTECMETSNEPIEKTDNKNEKSVICEKEKMINKNNSKEIMEKEEWDQELEKDEDDTTEKMNRIDADMYTLCLHSKYISKLNVCEELGIKKILVNPLIERMKKKGYLSANYIKNKGYESSVYKPFKTNHINHKT